MEDTMILKDRIIVDENSICSTYVDDNTIFEVEGIFNNDVSLEDAFFAALNQTKKSSK